MTPSRRQQGFSLIELIMFIVVIGLLAVGLMQAASNALQDPDQTRKMIQAAMLVQEKVEELRYAASAITDLGTIASPFNTTPKTENPVDATLFPTLARSTSYSVIPEGTTTTCPDSAKGDCRLYTIKVYSTADTAMVYAQADIYLVK